MDKTKFLKASRKKKAFLSDEDFTKLIKGMDTSKYAEYRDSVVIQLIFDTGMRVGETLLIDVTTDIDFQNRAINPPERKTAVRDVVLKAATSLCRLFLLLRMHGGSDGFQSKSERSHFHAKKQRFKETQERVQSQPYLLSHG